MNSLDIFLEKSASIAGVLLYFLAAWYVASYFGRKRQIGVRWSFLFCATGTPIFGIIVILFSKKSSIPPKESTVKKVIGWILALYFGITTLFSIGYLPQTPFYTMAYSFYLLLGIYLIGISKGKIYNKRLLMNDINNVAEPSGIELTSKNDSVNILKLISFIKLINNNYRIYLYILISSLLGLLLGWYYRLPTEELLFTLFKQKSEWRKDLALDLMRKSEPLFTSELFSFNWAMFIGGTILCFLCFFLLDYLKAWRYILLKTKGIRLKNVE